MALGAEGDRSQGCAPQARLPFSNAQEWKPVRQHTCVCPHVPVHTAVVLGGQCAGGNAAPEPPCCQHCPRGLSPSFLPFMVTTALMPPSNMSPASPMNMDPAVHRPEVVTLLQAAVILPTGLRASSLPCRRLAQAGPAPVLPQALPSATSHPWFILSRGVQPAHLLPGLLPQQIRAPPCEQRPALAPGPSPVTGGSTHAVPSHPAHHRAPAPA